MQFRFFVIPAHGGAEADELNQFLRSVRVVSVARELVVAGGMGNWHFCVEFLESGRPVEDGGRQKARVDYQKILPPEDFALFASLRKWRKDQGEAEGVPVYTIFTNEQLAQVAGKRPVTIAGLQEIEGIGEAKTAKYGTAIIEMVGVHAANGQALPTDS